jgi:glycoprotein 6-alpha-L-fucosyltransferase
MQSHKNKSIDPYYRIKSLDNLYFITNFNTISKVAIIDHYPINRTKTSNEISLKVGDVINIFLEQHFQNIHIGYTHNGYISGKNLRTNKIGIFPSYKVISYIPSSSMNTISLKSLSNYLSD